MISPALARASSPKISLHVRSCAASPTVRCTTDTHAIGPMPGHPAPSWLTTLRPTITSGTILASLTRWTTTEPCWSATSTPNPDGKCFAMTRT
eukprot:5003666-Pleurochrysis_carterae.AAC.1